METQKAHPFDMMSSPLLADKVAHNLCRMERADLSLQERRKLERDTNDMLFILSEREAA